MRIFISHATKNKEVVLKFAEFLESVSSEIEVFCSSENGSIKVGKDFIKTIFEELNSSALFIPVLSKVVLCQDLVQVKMRFSSS